MQMAAPAVLAGWASRERTRRAAMAAMAEVAEAPAPASWARRLVVGQLPRGALSSLMVATAVLAGWPTSGWTPRKAEAAAMAAVAETPVPSSWARWLRMGQPASVRQADRRRSSSKPMAAAAALAAGPA